MKLNYFLTAPTILLTAGLVAFYTIPQSHAYQDTGKYYQYRDYNYLTVGTGNLGITNELSSFNYQIALDRWLDIYTPDAFNIDDNLKTKLSAIDFIHGATEGNLSWNRNTNKWVLTNNFISHLEPSGSGRTYDNLGQYNTGITSTNCYIDRPRDTDLNPLCKTIFKQQLTNEWGVGSFEIDRKRNFFYDTKLPLLLSNYKAITIKQNAKQLIDHIYANGMGGEQTSIKLFYIDQINQLGLEGAKKLVTLDRKYVNYSRDNLLTIFKNLRVTNGEDVFTNSWGLKFNFRNLPTNVIRLLLSRMQYFNDNNNDWSFYSNQQWIADAARSSNVNQAQIVLGDAVRRYTLLPQSRQELDEMEKDAYNMQQTLKNIF
jgi:hypothetical protein